MSIVFHKMTGSGNDFVMIDGRTSAPGDWSPESIAAICDRRNGIGGDGLVFVNPVGENAVRMTYFNSDGSPAPMCGNAALCSTRLAARLEMADPAGMTLVTDAATFRTRCTGPASLAELNLPDVRIPDVVEVAREPDEAWIRFGTVGVPHVVALVGSIKGVDVERRGKALRFDAAFAPGGANINFIGPIPPSGPGAPAWQIRTYERGVEAETLACGTGTVAAAAALASLGVATLPLQVLSASGKILSVAGEVDGDWLRQVWLCGEGRVVARGVWLG